MEHRCEESLSRENARRLQDEGIAATAAYACAASPFYREVFANAGLAPGDVASGEDLLRLPTTSKHDVSQRNRDFLAVAERDVRDIVTTSGTTGKPTLWFMTGRDLDRLALNERLSFEVAGVKPEDVAFVSVTMDRCFVAGLAYYEGVKAIGAAAVRLGPASPAMHLDLMDELDPTVIVSVPSFLKRIAQYAREQGRALGRRMRTAVCIGEPVRDKHLALSPVGQFVEREWGVKVHSTYATTEICSTFCECARGAEDTGIPQLAFVEILDDDGNRLPNGQVGEVVVTPLGVEGMPLLRFRTGDCSFLIDERCACGLETFRLGPILGRKSQMLKIKGTTVFPAAVRRALDAVEGVSAYVMIATAEGELADRLEVRIAVAGDGGVVLAEARERLQGELKVTPDVTIAPSADIEALQCPPGSRKRRFFIDSR